MAVLLRVSSFLTPNSFAFCFLDFNAISLTSAVLPLCHAYHAPLKSSVAHCRRDSNDSGRSDMPDLA